MKYKKWSVMQNNFFKIDIDRTLQQWRDNILKNNDEFEGMIRRHKKSYLALIKELPERPRLIVDRTIKILAVLMMTLILRFVSLKSLYAAKAMLTAANAHALTPLSALIGGISIYLMVAIAFALLKTAYIIYKKDPADQNRSHRQGPYPDRGLALNPTPGVELTSKNDDSSVKHLVSALKMIKQEYDEHDEKGEKVKQSATSLYQTMFNLLNVLESQPANTARIVSVYESFKEAADAYSAQAADDGVSKKTTNQIICKAFYLSHLKQMPSSFDALAQHIFSEQQGSAHSLKKNKPLSCLV
jgi:hypothetical protein